MNTSEFESKFLGQDAIISINETGTLISIKLKHLPNIPIELGEEFKHELELEYESEIAEVLRENYRDSIDQDNHIKIESDKGKFI